MIFWRIHLHYKLIMCIMSDDRLLRELNHQRLSQFTANIMKEVLSHGNFKRT